LDSPSPTYHPITAKDPKRIPAKEFLFCLPPRLLQPLHPKKKKKKKKKRRLALCGRYHSSYVLSSSGIATQERVHGALPSPTRIKEKSPIEKLWVFMEIVLKTCNPSTNQLAAGVFVKQVRLSLSTFYFV
jgi:hypothetical protein